MDLGANEEKGELFFVSKRKEESSEISLIRTQHASYSDSIRKIDKWWKGISNSRNTSHQRRHKLSVHKTRFKRLQASERLTRLHRLMVGSDLLTDDEFWVLNPPQSHHHHHHHVAKTHHQLRGFTNEMVSDVDPDEDIAFNPLEDSRKLLFRVNRDVLTQILHEDPVTKHSFCAISSSTNSSNSTSSSSSPLRTSRKKSNTSSNNISNNTSISIESLKNRKFWKRYFKRKFKPPIPAPPPRHESRSLGSVYWIKRRLERIKRVSNVHPSVNIQSSAFDVDNTMFAPRWILPDTSSDSCGGRVTANTYMLLHRPHSRLVRGVRACSSRILLSQYI